MKICELTPEEARVYNVIPVGKENAIKRRDLVVKLEMKDRVVRRVLESINEKQYTVCNLMDGRGYYIPASELEYVEYERIINAYKCTLQRKEHAIKRAREKEYGACEVKPKGLQKRRKNALQQTRAI